MAISIRQALQLDNMAVEHNQVGGVQNIVRHIIQEVVNITNMDIEGTNKDKDSINIDNQVVNMQQVLVHIQITIKMSLELISMVEAIDIMLALNMQVVFPISVLIIII